MTTKLTHCVYWYETDTFDGKQKRVYRDFESLEIADNFAYTQKREKIVRVGAIIDLPWHHKHASLTV